MFLENDRIINLYASFNVVFTIPYLEDALEYYEMTENELRESLESKEFLEDFIQMYHIDISEMELIEWKNHN